MDLPEVLLDRETVAQRVRELGALISADYADVDLVVIGVLKGSFVFLADLVREITVPVILDFVSISSYGSSCNSSGIVKVTKDPEVDVQGKHVLIVEDIVDTGWTLKMSYLAENLLSGGAASVKVCTLLDKPTRRKVDIVLDYIGFEVPNQFVVGYGLDFDGLYRNLPFIGVIGKESPDH